jgi:hypothetical protein
MVTNLPVCRRISVLRRALAQLDPPQLVDAVDPLRHRPYRTKDHVASARKDPMQSKLATVSAVALAFALGAPAIAQVGPSGVGPETRPGMTQPGQSLPGDVRPDAGDGPLGSPQGIGQPPRAPGAALGTPQETPLGATDTPGTAEDPLAQPGVEDDPLDTPPGSVTGAGDPPAAPGTPPGATPLPGVDDPAAPGATEDALPADPGAPGAEDDPLDTAPGGVPGAGQPPAATDPAQEPAAPEAGAEPQPGTEDDAADVPEDGTGALETGDPVVVEDEDIPSDDPAAAGSEDRVTLEELADLAEDIGIEDTDLFFGAILRATAEDGAQVAMFLGPEDFARGDDDATAIDAFVGLEAELQEAGFSEVRQDIDWYVMQGELDGHAALLMGAADMGPDAAPDGTGDDAAEGGLDAEALRERLGAAGVEVEEDFEPMLLRAEHDGRAIFLLVGPDGFSAGSIDLSEDELREKLEEAGLSDVEAVDDDELAFARGSYQESAVLAIGNVGALRHDRD